MRYRWTIRVGEHPGVKWSVCAATAEGAIEEAKRMHRSIISGKASPKLWSVRCGKTIEGVAEDKEYE